MWPKLPWLFVQSSWLIGLMYGMSSSRLLNCWLCLSTILPSKYFRSSFASRYLRWIIPLPTIILNELWGRWWRVRWRGGCRTIRLVRRLRIKWIDWSYIGNIMDLQVSVSSKNLHCYRSSVWVLLRTKMSSKGSFDQWCLCSINMWKGHVLELDSDSLRFIKILSHHGS